MRHTRSLWVVGGFLVLACGGSQFEGFDEGVAGAPGNGEGGGKGGLSPGGRAASAGASGAPEPGNGGSNVGGEDDDPPNDRAGAGGSTAGRGGAGRGGTGASTNGGSTSSGGATNAGASTGGSASAGVPGAGTAGTAGSGGAAADPRCPERLPKNETSCKADGLSCNYDGRTGCLCAGSSTLSCVLADPMCPGSIEPAFAAPPAGGASGDRIVPVAQIQRCKCTNGAWQCGVL